MKQALLQSYLKEVISTASENYRNPVNGEYRVIQSLSEAQAEYLAGLYDRAIAALDALELTERDLEPANSSLLDRIAEISREACDELDYREQARNERAMHAVSELKRLEALIKG